MFFWTPVVKNGAENGSLGDGFTSDVLDNIDICFSLFSIFRSHFSDLLALFQNTQWVGLSEPRGARTQSYVLTNAANLT